MRKIQIQLLYNEKQQIETAISEKQKQLAEAAHGNDTALADANKKFAEHQRSKSAGTIFSNYQPRKQTLLNQRTAAVGKLQMQQIQYKNGELGTGTEMMPAYDREYTELSKHDLLQYEEKLRTIEENCETEFRESFLAKMRETLEKAERLFKDLNRTLC